MDINKNIHKLQITLMSHIFLVIYILFYFLTLNFNQKLHVFNTVELFRLILIIIELSFSKKSP